MPEKKAAPKKKVAPKPQATHKIVEIRPPHDKNLVIRRKVKI